MHPSHRKVPSYCHHKASGQAVVRINSKDIYLGLYGTPASKEKYHRVIAEWLAASQHTNAPQNARFESNFGLVKACLLRADEVTKVVVKTDWKEAA